MSEKVKQFVNSLTKKSVPRINSGDLVKVYQRVQEQAKGGTKERIQTFEGTVVSTRNGKGISSTITVRRVVDEIGVERIFPVHSPTVDKIEVLARARTKQAKLYYVRGRSRKKTKLRRTPVSSEERKKQLEAQEKEEEAQEKEEEKKENKKQNAGQSKE